MFWQTKDIEIGKHLRKVENFPTYTTRRMFALIFEVLILFINL